MSVKWASDVDPDDLDAAERYLSLLLDPHRASRARRALSRAHITTRRANDILRATRREPLDKSDPGVVRARLDIYSSKALSPVLIVSWAHGGDIADGYHRVSAIYADDPFGDVECVIAHIPRLEQP